jgi:hypothetical protein
MAYDMDEPGDDTWQEVLAFLGVDMKMAWTIRIEQWNSIG